MLQNVQLKPWKKADKYPTNETYNWTQAGHVRFRTINLKSHLIADNIHKKFLNSYPTISDFHRTLSDGLLKCL